MIKVRKFSQINKTETIIRNEVQSGPLESNKVSVINVVPATQTVDMVPLKKLTVLKSLTPIDGVHSRDKIPEILTVKVGKTEVYQQRKRMLPEYKELFAALMRLPDKEIQKKLLHVINNHNSIEHRTVETQTDPIEIKDLTNADHNEASGKETNKSNGSGNDTPKSKVSDKPGETLKKRKRKRKVSQPQVNKESRAKQLAKINKPKTSSVNGDISKPVFLDPHEINSSKRRRIKSFCISEYSSDVVNIYEDTETDIKIELEQSNNLLDNGLLPIQDAVVRNQTNKLNLQICIWQSHRGLDLNGILTEDDEDLLQLAVLNTCDPSIINLLLEKGLNANSLDADSNTIIHLAILNDITVSSLELLMKHITDFKLLLTLNDDGYTPLHLAIRQNRFLLAECLINVLDERLMNKVYYKRQFDELETDENVMKKHFKDYYEKVCLQMDVGEEATAIDNHELKQKLLQAGDRRSGNTALYFAIDNSFEHLVYFLLAHLIDPRTENLSGLDSKTYFSEFGKSLNLSLNIDNTMEKVIKLLS